MLEEFAADCVVVGAGVVGLAVARAFAISGRDVLVIEAAPGIGSETSSRNSEVIHAGIYYPKDSLKARACVAGKAALYQYLTTRRIAHRRCEKLIVASDEGQVSRLDEIVQKGRANGVDDLVVLSRPETVKLEPQLRAVAAIRSPSTGIVDSHAFMLSLQGDVEDHGGAFAFSTRVERGECLEGGEVALWCGGPEACIVKAKLFVNCAGLHASRLAHAIDGLPEALIPETNYAKGNYFALSGRAPFSRLIYPIPEPGGLGVHLTLDLAGQARFGPDVEWVDAIDYTMDASRSEGFYGAIRKYWPDLRDGALYPAYCGIRPKLTDPGDPAADFVILGPDAHGLSGQIHLFGIESPGLTSSLALADRVVDIANGRTQSLR